MGSGPTSWRYRGDGSGRGPQGPKSLITNYRDTFVSPRAGFQLGIFWSARNFLFFPVYFTWLCPKRQSITTEISPVNWIVLFKSILAAPKELWEARCFITQWIGSRVSFTVVKTVPKSSSRTYQLGDLGQVTELCHTSVFLSWEWREWW